jgi:hypothetical protein
VALVAQVLLGGAKDVSRHQGLEKVLDGVGDVFSW